MMNVSTEHEGSGNSIYINLKLIEFYIKKKYSTILKQEPEISLL